MNHCPTCGTAMKDLFTGQFCPRDCDRRPVVPLIPATASIIEMVLRKVPSVSRGHVWKWTTPLGERMVWLGIFSPGYQGPLSSIVMTMNPKGLDRRNTLLCDVILGFNSSIVVVVKNRFGGFSYDEVPDAK